MSGLHHESERACGGLCCPVSGRRSVVVAPGSALDAHPKPSPNAPTLATATARARETVWPAEPGEILATSLVIRKPVPKLLVRPRVVDPAHWVGTRRHSLNRSEEHTSELQS